MSISKKIFEPERIEVLHQEFENALPYKHVVIENFLEDSFAESLYKNFPGFDLMSRNYRGLNEKKSEGSGFENFHPDFSILREQIKSKEFCQFLSKVTGIEDLYSVEDALGSGVHQGGDGSYLDVHIDFNIHYERNIHRRVNLLIFLNKNWKESYGGKIELWNKDVSVCEKAYLPSFNRCVIFETSEISYHGYSTIHVPEGESRKSFYGYFYTDIREGAATYHDTIFKARPEEGIAKKIKTDVKETIKNNVKRVFKKVGIKI
jgi:Rps23 Pro-64 3,4-dihydroxylase Tpa1-like proline 4-hydroxylase